MVEQFNEDGQVVLETIQTIRPGLSDPERHFYYNEDGDLVLEENPAGDSVSHVVPRLGVDLPSYYTRLNEANDIERRHEPGPRGGDQPSIRTYTLYEPIYNKPFKKIGARGYETGDLQRFTTTYYYDYMEDLAAAQGDLRPTARTHGG